MVAGLRRVGRQQPHADDPRPGRPRRIEHRGIDGSANPYLAATAVLAAGLDGIERKLDPGPQNTANLYTARRRRSPQAHQEPADDALDADRASAQGCRPARLVRHTGAEDYSDYFADTKLREFQDGTRDVSEWEVDRYLTLF